MILLCHLRKNGIGATIRAFFVVIGTALAVVLAGFAPNFDGPYQSTFDSLAKSFSLVKTSPHSTQARGIQSLGDGDVDALKRSVDPKIVANVIPSVQGVAVLSKDDSQYRATLVGVPPDYLAFRNTELIAGSMFTERQYDDSARVILLGDYLVKFLFANRPESAINSTIRIGRLNFRVIGIVGNSAVGTGAATGIVPMTTARSQLLGGPRTVGQINIVATSPDTEAAAEVQASKILEQAHTPKKRGLDDDFGIVRYQSAELANSSLLLKVLFYVALGIAAISLIVGVFVLVAFMRTAMASRAFDPVGSTWKIRCQIFAESAIMAGMCGLAGIGAGAAAIFAGQRLLPELAPEYGTPTVPSAVVPTVFGTTVLVLVLGACLYLAHRGPAAASLHASAPARVRVRRAATPERAQPRHRPAGLSTDLEV
jgi:putative ABC transport system permease protein